MSFGATVFLQILSRFLNLVAKYLPFQGHHPHASKARHVQSENTPNTRTALSIPGDPSRSANMAGSDKNGQSAEDEAEQRRKAIMAQAMAADLGINRVEELPLEDVDPPPHRPARHDGPAPNPGQGNTRLSMPQAPPAQSSIWAEAQQMGAFDDDDARGVKDLDDLGGGRIYALRQQEASALATRLVQNLRNRNAHHPPMQNPELHSHAARHYHGRGREIPPNRKINFGKDMTTSDFGVVHHTAQPVKRFPANYQPPAMETRPVASPNPPPMVPPNRGLPPSRNGVVSRATSTAPLTGTPRGTPVQSHPSSAIQAQRESRPTIAPRAIRQISLDMQQPSAPTTRRQPRPAPNESIVPISENNPPQHSPDLPNESVIPISEHNPPEDSPDLPNVVFKRVLREPSQTVLYLSAAPRPLLGWFTIIRQGQLVCQWPLSQYYWHDIDGRRLSTMFNTLGGPRDIRTMLFMAQMDADDFHRTLKRLRDGEYLDLTNEGSKNALETTTRDSTLITVEPSPSSTPQTSAPQVQTEEESVSDLDTVIRQPIGPNVNTAHGAESQETMVGTLIDFDTFDDAPSTTHPQHGRSEAAELLSTLDPIDYEPEHVDDDLQSQQAQFEDMDIVSMLGPNDHEHGDNTLPPISPSQQLQSETAEPSYGLEFVKQKFVENYRELLQNLIRVIGQSPAYQTNSGASAMIEGLKITVTNAAMTDECGLDDSTKKELLKEIWGDSQPVDAANSTNNAQLPTPNSPPPRSETPRPPPRVTTKAPPSGVTSQTRRRVYDHQTLVSLYDNRLQPPHWLTELGFMPPLTRRNPRPSIRQTLEATLSARTLSPAPDTLQSPARPATPSPDPYVTPRPAPDWSRKKAHVAWLLASQTTPSGEPTSANTSDSTVRDVQVEATEAVELMSTTRPESTAQDMRPQAQEIPTEEHRQHVSVMPAAVQSHGEHVGAHIHNEPELISLGVPEPARPLSTQTNVRGLRHSRWARPGDRIETEGNFTGPQFLTSAILRDLAQLDPQAPVNATPEDLANIFSARPSDQRMEHVGSGPTPDLPNARSIPVPDHRPTTPVNYAATIDEDEEETPRASQRIVDIPAQQPSPVSAPPAQIEPPVASRAISNRSVAGSMVTASPAPEVSFLPVSSFTEQFASPVVQPPVVPTSSSATPGLTGSMWARNPAPATSNGTNVPPPQVQSSGSLREIQQPEPRIEAQSSASVVGVQQPISVIETQTQAPVAETQPQASVAETQPSTLAPRPTNRGLAGSRFASGNVLPSAGTFTGYFVPKK
ncbi:hypothetical protein B0T20DRAFT_472848 [Sordaria brevicollis]|uniref:Uncharacterized protein n=1 Tax=Sordaria brevicollis TaxID=83679 RepID=A0AAE0P2P3_SORBR|nr:hypothetical protein B0T20DRAFT_472848 [Sordaria brevicollis]